MLDKDQDLVESCPTESRFWESRNEKVEVISSSVNPNKVSIFEEATHDYYATRVRPRGDERDYRKAWIIQVLGPVLPRLGPYYLLLVLTHALPGALILVKPRAYEVYGAWRG